MVKRSIFLTALIVFAFALILFNISTVYFFGVPFSPVALTGKVVETGHVFLYVDGGEKTITIHSPENTIYDNNSYTCSVSGSHPKCDDDRYLLPLNASADFLLEETGDIWKYTLYDLKHGVWIEETPTPFTPGVSIPFVRWENELTVFANERDVFDWVNNSVILTVDVPNTSPLIQNFTEEIFVCESERLDILSESYFNIYDIDEEDFSISGRVRFNLSGSTFGVVRNLAKTSIDSIHYYISPIHMYSGKLAKEDLGKHVGKIEVKDSATGTDDATVEITVIEINNPPVIDNELGPQTIYATGSGSSFYHDYNVTDVEVDDGDGNLTFSLISLTSEPPKFDINSSTGVMSYNPGVEDAGKTYELRVCVVDTALSSVPDNFSICAARDNPHSYEALSDCDDFRITVTNDNRLPSIDLYSPLDRNFSVPGTTQTIFSVTVSDLDMTGDNYPSINWYLDGVLQVDEGSENEASDEFAYTLGCGVSGIHNVSVIVSDGMDNSSLDWNFSVTNVACPVDTPSGDGGGGGGGGGGTLGGVCNELWSCNTWELCQNVQRSFSAATLSPEDFSSAKDLCYQNQYDDRFCGFQITNCFDLKSCENTEFNVPKPVESRVCYFTENPNCIDGITNCHDGSCELLVDCGGPCDPCPTCSDSKRNQGEEGVDCGGPCPFACEAESPFKIISIMIISLLVISAIVAIFIILKLVNILRYRFFFAGKKKKKKEDKR